MPKSILMFFGAVVLSLSQVALAEVQLRPDAPEFYEIRPGDSHLSLSERYLENPGEWHKLWWGDGQANIHNPHELFPGQRLVLKRTGGRPNLSVMGGSTKPIVVLAPGMDDVTQGYSIPILPTEFLRNFMMYPKILTEKQIQDDPVITKGKTDRIIFGVNDRIYAKKLPRPGRYIIYRPEAKIYDPDNGRYLGYEVTLEGEAKTVKPTTGRAVDRRPGDELPDDLHYGESNRRMHELHPFLSRPTYIARPLVITKMSSEIRNGDKLMYVPEDAHERFNFELHNPSSRIRGKVIRVYNGINMASTLQTVAFNRGQTHGIRKGSVLSVYHKLPADNGESGTGKFSIDRVEYPAERVAHAVAYEVGPSLTYALVFGNVDQVHIGDIVSNSNQHLSDFNMPNEHIPNWILDLYDKEGSNAPEAIADERSRRAFDPSGNENRSPRMRAPSRTNWDKVRFERVKQNWKSGKTSLQNP